MKHNERQVHNRLVHKQATVYQCIYKYKKESFPTITR